MSRYSITGMHCAACQQRVEKAVSKISSVESASASLLTNTLDIVGDASREEIIKAVEDAGYGARPIDGDLVDEDILKDQETPRLRRRLISSVGVLLILMYFSMGHAKLDMPLPFGMGNNPASIAFVQMVLAAIIMLINGHFFTSGFRSLLRFSPNMDSLVALGSMTSFVWSLVITFRITGAQAAGAMDEAMSHLHQLYFESAAMIVTLITVGKLLEAMSKGRTTDALKSLIQLSPKKALVERQGSIVEIAAEEIRVGDIFICRAGDTFPVDGEVVEGETRADESALTGESVLVVKRPGDPVSAATINMGDEIRAKATRVGEDTTLSQIIRMVSDATATKAPIARIADKVSGVFVPAVIVIAALVIVIWLAVGAGAGYALARGISVLVISCPCALGLATPVAIMVGNGVGAKKGILFKTAQSLEQTGKVGIIALDKTGTITEGDATSDRVKADSKEAIKQLKRMGIGTMMLTGDKPDIAGRIGEQVGIDRIASGLLPQDKDKVVKGLMGEVPVAMVGDGINDAPALTSADVGIAIGAGKDVAIDAADVVLMNSTISDVAAAVRLSRATLRNIHQNLFWAFFYNILLIPLAAGAYTGILHGFSLSPMVAAAAMSLSSFCVCMNALRLNLFDPYDSSGDRPLRGARQAHIMEDKKTTDWNMSDIKEYNTGSKREKEEAMSRTINIEGMMCEHCEATVKKAIESLDGVSEAQVSHEEGRAVVEMTSEVGDEELKKAVEDKDYKVLSIE